MDSEQNTLDAAVPKDLKNQTDISTGIGPTGTDTPAPKDVMPHADHLVCLRTLNLDVIWTANRFLLLAKFCFWIT